MAGRGSKPGERRGGRQKGTRNRTTLEREREAQQEADRIKALEDAAGGVEGAKTGTRKLGKQILDEFANVLAGAAAYYQPRADGSNTNADETKFFRYSELAIYAAEKVAQYQSPKLSAVLVGQTQVRQIKVIGGLPDGFDALNEAPPAGEHAAPQLSPPAPVPVTGK